MTTRTQATILGGATLCLLAFAQFSSGVDPGVRASGTLYFTADVFERDSSNILCGERTTYNLTETPPPMGQAYLGRSVLEAHSCVTDWDFNVTQSFTIAGDVEAFFPLGCEFIGVIQNVQALGLESVGVSLLKNNAVVASGQHFVSNPICSATNPYQVGVVITDVDDKGHYEVNDVLTVRVNLRAINTESAILRYWYLEAGAANITAPGLLQPEPTETTTATGPTTTTTGTGTTTTETSPTTTATTTDTTSPTTTSPSEGAPQCARDDPPQEDIQRPPGEDFTLRAACTDPDDDLDHGTWTVDDEPFSEDPLGPSPSTADETFNFEEEGAHTIRFEPVDQEGDVGEPATWTVTIAPEGTTTTSPTETGEIPFFPSSAALAIGILGALGGALVVFWRKP